MIRKLKFKHEKQSYVDLCMKLKDQAAITSENFDLIKSIKYEKVFIMSKNIIPNKFKIDICFWF